MKLFSTSSRSCSIKQPWGCISDCKFPVNNSCFGLKNKQGSSQAFQKSQLDPSLWKICPFTTSWLAMRAEGKEEKLARFVSHMLKCKQFVHHPSDENYNKDGLDLRHNTLTEEETVEFLQFLSEAVDAKMDVESLSAVPSMCNGMRKRRQVDSCDDEERIVRKKRLTRAEEVEKAKLLDLEDENGMEAKVKRSIVTRRCISLDNLTYSKKLAKESPMNDSRTRLLLKSVKENFDLSQMTLTVCPDPDYENCDVMSEDCKFVVISGRYRLAVLKNLDEQQLLTGIAGCEDREVMCVILDTTSASDQSYIHHRSNKIQSDVLGFRCEALVFTALELHETIKDTAEVAETIRRFAVNLEIPAEEVGILKKLALW